MSDLQENLEERMRNDRRTPVVAKKIGPSASFFTVYRPHQGGWTRLGTAIASAIFIGGTALFLAYDVATTAKWSSHTTIIVVSLWVIVSSAAAWWAQNKAMHVEFIIDTDSEMKKVNWTSRKELIGSTKVVILFMLIMSTMLFFIDLVFQLFFYSIDVLKFSPFAHAGGK